MSSQNQEDQYRRSTYVLEIWFLEFSLEGFIPALVHGVLLEVVDIIDNFISGRGNRFFDNSFNNSCYLLATEASYESISVDE